MLFSARSTRGAHRAPGLLLLLLTLGFSATAHASPPISTSELPAAEPPSTIVPPWVRHQRRRQAEREHGHGHGHEEHAHGREVRRSEGTGVGGEGAEIGGREGHRSAPPSQVKHFPSFRSSEFVPGVADFWRPAWYKPGQTGAS